MAKKQTNKTKKQQQKKKNKKKQTNKKKTKKKKNYQVYPVPFSQFALHPIKGNIGKQCSPRSDAAERGVWSGYTLFTLSTEIQTGNEPIQSDWWKRPLGIKG